MSRSAEWSRAARLGGLRRFAASITVVNVAGHTLLGFEQSLAQPLVGLATAYGLELLLEWIDARTCDRRPGYRGRGVAGWVDFLLSAHITGLAVPMLLYANERLVPVAFATAVAMTSKRMLRVTVDGRSHHFLNPSNFGIVITLLLFPWVCIAPPYHFTENVAGTWDWVLPAIIVASGTLINARFAHRLPLVGAWLAGFVVQAGVRHVVFDAALLAALGPLTGLAFLLFTFYMVTDPATTPVSRESQVVFGFAVSTAYGVLMALHVTFGLFFALAIVCTLRGAALWVVGLTEERHRRRSPVPALRESA